MTKQIGITFNIADLVREVVARMRTRFDRVPCQIHILADPAIITGSADRLAACLVFSLIEYAHAVTVYEDDEAAEICVSVRADHAGVTLIVEDRGPPACADSGEDHFWNRGVHAPDRYLIEQLVAHLEATMTINNLANGANSIAVRFPAR